MKSRSLALSLMSALLAGSAYDVSAANTCSQSSPSQARQTDEISPVDSEEKNRVRADAIRDMGARLRGDG